MTENNTEISRSHLIIENNLSFKNGNSAKFTIIDLGGSEDPFIIGQKFLRIDPLALKAITKNDIKMLLFDITNPKLKIRSTFWDKEMLNDFVKTTKTNIDMLSQETRPGNRIKIKVTQNNDKRINQVMNKLFLYHFRRVFGKNFSEIFNPFTKMIEYLWNMLTEAFFINESLNHLKIFLQQESNQEIRITRALKSSKDDIYKLITAEEMKIGADKTRYSPDKLLMNPIQDDKLGFMKLLRTIKSQNKPTKFVLLATLSDTLNKMYCDGTSSTLDFAHQLIRET